MNAKLNQSKSTVNALLFSAIVLATSSLLGCNQQPKSMFEKQAETDAANELTTAAISDDKAVIKAPATTTNKAANIRINKQQAIARQPNCDINKKICQYFELNVLAFSPEQPWLNSIMWKTIAQVLTPEAPLASQDQTAKDTILMSLKQIEYGEQVVDTLPMYERIDTELVLHPVRTTDQDSGANSAGETIATGYLLVRSTEERGSSHQYLDYVMLDIQKKLQLTIKDILLPKVSIDDLLSVFASPQQDWLISQGVDKKQLNEWPLQLSEQWYLDVQGLHMVYQSRELLDADTDAVDLIVPYAQLKGLIKPYYIVESTIN